MFSCKDNIFRGVSDVCSPCAAAGLSILTATGKRLKFGHGCHGHSNVSVSQLTVFLGCGFKDNLNLIVFRFISSHNHKPIITGDVATDFN